MARSSPRHSRPSSPKRSSRRPETNWTRKINVRATYSIKARADRDEICRLLQTTPLDTDDLATIRLVLDSRARQLQDEEQQRMAEQRVGGSPDRQAWTRLARTVLGAPPLG